MKNVFLYSWLCGVFSMGIYGQIQNNNWTIAVQGGLNFSTNIPQPISSNIGATLSSASVSDQNGDLLFYTDGHSVWGSNNVLLQNGTGLLGLGGDYDQNTVIIPNPTDINKYYIFVISSGQFLSEPFRGLRYSEVDMSNGVGVVISATKNTALLDSSLIPINDLYFRNFGKITSAPHQNGLDYWLIAEVGTNVYSYLVDDMGIHTPIRTDSPILASNSVYMDTNPVSVSAATSGNGPMKISPDSQRILIGYSDTFDIANFIDGGKLFVGRFDNSTGQIFNWIELQRPQEVEEIVLSGAEFSPDSNTVHRFHESIIVSSNVNLNGGNLVETGMSFTVNNFDSRNLQRALDGRLYFENYNLANINPWFIGVCQNPNGVPYNFQYFSISTGSSSTSSTIPSWVHWQNCHRYLTTSNLITTSLNSQRNNWIVSSDVINSPIVSTPTRVIYHAGDFIELLPGFETQNDSEFVAYIQGCSGNFLYRNVNAETNSNQEASKANVTVDKLQIFPNPSNTFVTIALDSDKIRSVVITSIDGKVIQSLNVNSNSEQIDVSSFTNGLYLITVQTNDGRNIVNKFIKN